MTDCHSGMCYNTAMETEPLQECRQRICSAVHNASKAATEAVPEQPSKLPFSVAWVALRLSVALRERSLSRTSDAVLAAFKKLKPNERFIRVSDLTQALAIVKASPVFPHTELCGEVVELISVLSAQVEDWWEHPQSAAPNTTYWRNQVCGCARFCGEERTTPPRHVLHCCYRK